MKRIQRLPLILAVILWTSTCSAAIPQTVPNPAAREAAKQDKANTIAPIAATHHTNSTTNSQQTSTQKKKTFKASPVTKASSKPQTKPASQPVARHTTTTSSAKPKPSKPAYQPRLWNLRNVDILDVINEVSRDTGKNFVVDPRVQGKITMISSHSMSAAEVYQVFLTLLHVAGYSAVNNGSVVNIIPNLDAREAGAPVISSKNTTKGDRLEVRVLQIKNVTAEQLVPILRPLLPDWAQLTSYRPSNSLIITANANNIDKIVNIVKHIDTPSTNGVDVVTLNNATATNMVHMLNTILQSNRNNGLNSNISIGADDRTNSVILSGNGATRLQIKALVGQLDAPTSSKASNINVIFLHYLKAKDLAAVLNGQPEPESNSSAGFSSDNASNGGDINSSTLNSSSYSLNNDTGSSASSASTSAASAIPTSSSGSSTGMWGKGVIIAAENNTNSLIIHAPPSIMQELEGVIHRLDVRPAQVLVEAVIAEVSEGTMQQLGIQWGTKGSDSSSSSTTNDSNDNDSGDSAKTPGDIFNTITGGLGLGVLTRGRFKMLITALGSDTNTNILSTPSLIVLDNQKAEIKVGQQLSFQTGSYASSSSGSTVNPYNTVSQQNVGLTLDVTPQINEGDSVQLQIAQENDNRRGTEVVNGNPVINNTLIKTSVIVRDGDVLVLGGLITNDIEKTNSKVPILGDIPIIGRAFQSSNDTLEKRNLMVFLRPVIVRTPQQGLDLTSGKYNFIRKRQVEKLNQRNWLYMRHLTPVLPSWTKKESELPEPFSHG